MDIPVKQEATETTNAPPVSIRTGGVSLGPGTIIELSSSDSDSSSSDSDDGAVLGGESKRPRVLDVLAEASSKRTKLDAVGDVLPPGFLDALPPAKALSPTSAVMRLPAPPVEEASQPLTGVRASGQSSKQFWKAGDYEGTPGPSGNLNTNTGAGGMDHVRVHPKFLHSNATSHKWVLGAFAELLDNSLDEVGSGATFVNIDKRENKKDGSRMLVTEDNGGGMDPEKLRHCMSLGYSAKSKEANTIGQYGNGFKTSTMRLGADVIVFSRCSGKDGKSLTQSIGLLSYTFLRSTGKEDIVVPMLDYERGGREWKKIIRSSSADWNRTVETIVQWSPFSSESDLLREFYLMKEHGTRIIIYNLWEDDQGQMELDFDTDPHDIQIRGVNRDEKNIQMAKQYPNSWHFLTYRHSLRSYASILYLRLPPGFRIILRGKDVVHHNIVNDMMMSEEVTYRPQPGADGVLKDSNMVASVTIGFVKDAKYHIDVQGFNVYHKNRLIKPFWRIWNAAGSDGRGVIGVLEANFVEPAHDKQGFERTIVLSRLETRLIQMQKNYWCSNCQKIGYAPRRNKKLVNESADRESSPEYGPQTSTHSKRQHTASSSKTSDKLYSPSNQKWGGKELGRSSKILDLGSRNRQASIKGQSKMKVQTKSQKRPSSSGPSSPYAEDVNDDDVQIAQSERPENGSSHEMYAERLTPDMEVTEPQQDCTSGGKAVLSSTRSQSKVHHLNENACSRSNSDLPSLDKLKEENRELRKRLQGTTDGEIFGQLLLDLQLERDRCKNLESDLQVAKQKIGDFNKKDEDLKEQENLVLLLLEERDRLKKEEEHLRNKLKDASNTIQKLLDKVKVLEKMKSPNSKG